MRIIQSEFTDEPTFIVESRVTLSHVNRTILRALLRNGDFVTAVAYVRDTFKIRLIEARDIVKFYREEWGL